ncbi:MAG: type III-A CRISPR-associated RAMP protein Csm3 [Proteobacteria bacterium]|nr:type III-A CRISPR-associated RAMP protein Csm3 [Pseudomonadota bacterium]
MKVKKPEFDFIGKYIITADIMLKTGLHIGGTEEGFDIGGIDNPVIKDKVTGVPYIPGSSLKGKMRSLIEWAYNKVQIDPVKEKDESGKEKIISWTGKLCSDPNEPIGVVFGVPAENHRDDLPGPTRLAVRDAYPDENQIKKWQDAMGEKIYTEAKTENAIDRLTSAANPRSMERVPGDSIFKAEFVYDVYNLKKDVTNLKLLFEGMMLLEDSYLGGGGTRGSGKVEFGNIQITARDKNYYLGIKDKDTLLVKQNGHKKPKDISDKFNTIFPVTEG